MWRGEMHKYVYIHFRPIAFAKLIRSMYKLESLDGLHVTIAEDCIQR